MSPGIFYTSNPAEYTRVAGVYVTEQAPPGFVQGVSLNTVGIAGATVRGPVDTPVEITSFARFAEIFGGRDYSADGSGPVFINEIRKVLLAGPFGKVVVSRAAAAAAVKASFTLGTVAAGSGTAVLQVDASSPGAWAGSSTTGSLTGVKVKVETATDADANHFNIRVKYLGATKLYENIDIHATGTDNTLAVLGDDYGNWITLTKLANGVPITTGMSGLDTDGYVTLGQTVASFTAVLGADGTIADTDYTATGRAIDKITTYAGVACVLIAERSGATINGSLVTKSVTATDRMFLIWSGTHADSVSTVASSAASLNGTDRMVFCYDSPYILDPDTATQIQVPPHHAMACCFSQTSVNQHVGSNRTKAFNAAIKKLTNETLTREDYATLRAAGICGLERAANGGFVFVDGVTMNKTAGLTEIARRREADFITISLSTRLQDFVKEEDTEDVQAEIAGEAIDFLSSLQRAKSIVKAFSVEQGNTVNTDAARAQGIEVLATNVKFYTHILGLVLLTDMGTGNTVASNAA